MSDSIIKLRIDSQEYDNKLKRAAEGLTRYADKCRQIGGTMEVVEKETLDYVKAVGQMETKSRSANGKLSEMKKAFMDLGHQYQQLTDAEKASPFGVAMSQSLDQLKVRIQESKSQIDELARSMNGVDDKAPKGSSFLLGMGDKMEGAISVFAGNMMTKAVGLAGELAMKLQASVEQGIALAEAGEGIQMAFDRLNRPDLLGQLREATHGTVTDLELMKAAVRFQDFKLPLDELGTMLAFAQQKAKDTGQSIDYMTESIVTGLGRKSVMILDNLGISAAEIKDRMKETGDMTKAVGDIIREQMASAGDYVETTADRAKRAEVDLENAMTDLGKTLLPLKKAGTDVFTAIEVSILHMLNEAAEPAVPAIIGLGEALDELKDAATENWVTNGFVEWAKTGLNYVSRLIPGLDALKVGLEKLKQMGTDKAGVAGGAAVGGAIADILPKKKEKEDNNPDPTTVVVKPVITPGSIADFQNQIKTLREAQNQVTNHEAWQELEDKIIEATYLMQQLQGLTRLDGLGVGSNLQGVSISGMDGYGTQAVAQRQAELQNMKLGYINFDSPEAQGASVWGLDESGKEDEGINKNTDALNKVSTAMSGLSQITSGLQAIGIDLGDDAKSILSGFQGLINIIQGVSSVIQVFSGTTQTANTLATNANTIALNLLASVMKINAATSLIPLAGGGVVHAATGITVPGNSFSGDMVPAMLNSGETVFNRAQMGVLATELGDGGRNAQPTNVRPYVEGDKVFLGINNSLRQSGQGELVTTSMLHRLGLT